MSVLRTVWVTRAEPGASETAARLSAMGFSPVVAPLLAARPLRDVRLDLTDVGALAFTSARAVDAYAALSEARPGPVFTVGDATAEAARAAGFGQVHSADGDVHALAELIAGARPEGVLLHLAAAQPAGDLVGDLNGRGVPARRLAVYETVPLSPPPPAADAVLVHSARAAAVLAELLTTPPPLAFVLSAAVAAPLLAANFGSIAIAPFPNEASLLSLLAKAAQRPGNESLRP